MPDPARIGLAQEPDEPAGLLFAAFEFRDGEVEEPQQLRRFDLGSRGTEANGER